MAVDRGRGGLRSGGSSGEDGAAWQGCAAFMAKSQSSAGPNAAAPDGVAGNASASTHGEGTAAAGAKDTTTGFGLSFADALARDTVAAHVEAQRQAEMLPGVPEQAREKSAAAQQTAKPKPKASLPDEDDDADEDADESTEDSEDAGDQPAAKPILPDDEDADSDVTADSEDAEGEEDGESGEATKEQIKKLKALEKDNFKTREANRKLKAELDEKLTKLQEMETQLKNAGTVNNAMPAGFEHVKSVSDLDALDSNLEAALEWAEDHAEEGYIGKNAAGEEVEYTPQQVRDYRRGVQKQMKQTVKVRDMLKAREQRETQATAEAKLKYPFVSNAESPRHALVKSIEIEFPEVKTSPARALLLGRLAVASLIESGEYELTRKPKVNTTAGGSKAKAAPLPPSPTPRPAARKESTAPKTASMDWAMSLAQKSMALIGADAA